MRLPAWACLASALIMAEGQTPGAQEPPQDLRALRSGLRRNLLTVVIPEMKTHRDELLALEQKQAAAQDYAGAVQARDARIAVERQIAALEQEAALLSARSATGNATAPTAKIELKLSEAQLAGVQMDASDGALTGWDHTDASAAWKLPGLPAGGYDIVLRCTGSADTVTVKESFYTLTGACKDSKDNTMEQTLGTLRIRDGSGILTLRVTPPEKCAGWRVYSVMLVPST